MVKGKVILIKSHKRRYNKGHSNFLYIIIYLYSAKCKRKIDWSYETLFKVIVLNPFIFFKDFLVVVVVFVSIVVDKTFNKQTTHAHIIVH